MKLGVILVFAVTVPLRSLFGAVETICANALLGASPYAALELVSASNYDLASQYRQYSSRIGASHSRSSLAFSPNSQWLYAITAGMEGTVVNRWRLADGSFDNFSLPVPNSTQAIAVSPTGTQLALAHDATFSIWDVDSRQQITYVSSVPKILQLEFTQNANHLLVATDSGHISVRGLDRKIRYSWGLEVSDMYTIDPNTLPWMTHEGTTIGNRVATADMADEYNRKRRATHRKLRKGTTMPWPSRVVPMAGGSRPLI